MGVMGRTRQVTLTDNWQKLVDLDDLIGDETFSGVWLSVRSYAGAIAFGEHLPQTSGHSIAVGMFYPVDVGSVKKTWLKNDTAGSTATLILTPESDL